MSLDSYDVTGGTVDSIRSGGVVPEKLVGGTNSVIGRPHRFNANADPAMRTFVRHMLPAAPLVLIRPGRIKFSEDTENWLVKKLQELGHKDDAEAKALLARKDASGQSVPTSLFSKNYGVTDEDLSAVNQAIKDKQKGTVLDILSNEDNLKSARYFEFNSSNEVLKEYQSVMYTLSSRLAARMQSMASNLTLWNSVKGAATGEWQPESLINAGFYTFWADNASSVSESASNEVGPTKLGGLVKTVAEISREAQFFLKSDLGAQSTKMREGMVENAIKGVSDFIGGDMKDGGVRASLGDAILGMNPMFPEVWKDSSFSRSYTLNFKFHSPYGHPMAVYQNVLGPFIMLLSLVMPVSSGMGTYSEPFVFQVDCPGYFACDLGICTDFSFTKGGSENLWTIDGLPRQIDVNMQIRDLYPVLAASRNNDSLFFNVGMGTFLDNLAGIALYKTKDGKGDLAARMKAGVYNSMNLTRGAADRWGAGLQGLNQQYNPLANVDMAKIFGG
jgi:hypothetical protein